MSWHTIWKVTTAIFSLNNLLISPWGPTISKIMYMSVEKHLHIRVIVSLNILPMKLSALPKAFGLKKWKMAGSFKENQHYIGPYPEPEFYGIDFMSNGEKKEFLQWHQTKRDGSFNFKKEMSEYCWNDADILKQARLKFRSVLMSATGKRKTKLNLTKMKTVWALWVFSTP